MSEPETAPENPNSRFKRKRKKSFLKNARKYGKKGCYGRGTQLDPDTYQYFIRIMEAYRDGFETDDDKTVFVNNVFEQTVGEEINICCNQVGCRVIETLIPLAGEKIVERFMKVFGEDMRPLCSDRFASHVLEALILKSCDNCYKPDMPPEVSENSKNFALKVSKFLLNNLEDYIWDTYGSHVIRTCLEGLSQTRDNKENLKEIKTEEFEVPLEFQTIITDYGERVLHWPQFSDFPKSEYTSGFLQVLLKSLKKVDKKLFKKYLDKLLTECFAQTTDNHVGLEGVFLSKPSMMVLETCFQLAKKKTFTQIYLQCFSGKLAQLSCTRSTNFTVQKLITNCKDKGEFDLIFDELQEIFGDIIKAGHSGVIYALGQACKRLSTKQGSFVQSLMKSFNCFEPEERQNSFVLCLSRFSDYDSMPQTNDGLAKEKLNLHGTLILQLILEFNKPIKLVHSLLSMDADQLLGLFSNTMGSHIVDSYVKSLFVGEKSREKLVRKMKGTYQELAGTKYGSRSFEALFNAAGLKHKVSIMDELAYKDGAWANSEHGKIIANKINLNLFKRNKDDWRNSLNTVNKAKEIFADILKD